MNKKIDNMSVHELMLFITENIVMEEVPKIDQSLFDELVWDAINSEYALENVWRLAMCYDEYGFNYDIIDRYFVDSGDAYYLSEYISGVIQVNQEKMVKMLIDKKDRACINDFLNKYIDGSSLDSIYIDMLRECVNDKNGE